MDILRKELNAIYDSQHLSDEILDNCEIQRYKHIIESLASVSDALYVITDALADHCYIYSGSLARLLGLTSEPQYCTEQNSSDEDVIYSRIHPADLVEKRMLEYEFFKFVNPLSASEKKTYVATSRFRKNPIRVSISMLTTPPKCFIRLHVARYGSFCANTPYHPTKSRLMTYRRP